MSRHSALAAKQSQYPWLAKLERWKSTIFAVAFVSGVVAPIEHTFIAFSAWFAVFILGRSGFLRSVGRGLDVWQRLLIIGFILGVVSWVVFQAWEPAVAQSSGGASFMDPLKTRINTAFTNAGAPGLSNSFNAMIDIFVITLAIFGVGAIFYGIWHHHQGYTIMQAIGPLSGILVGAFGSAAFIHFLLTSGSITGV